MTDTHVVSDTIVFVVTDSLQWGAGWISFSYDGSEGISNTLVGWKDADGPSTDTPRRIAIYAEVRWRVGVPEAGVSFFERYVLQIAGRWRC